MGARTDNLLIPMIFFINRGLECRVSGGGPWIADGLAPKRAPRKMVTIVTRAKLPAETAAALETRTFERWHVHDRAAERLSRRGRFVRGFACGDQFVAMLFVHLGASVSTATPPAHGDGARRSFVPG
jgi:hypothetical protein